ncbi:MAG: UDP-4-amino-4,6-dideoxy-N-acetyl-beta-L-altrosamine transaminase [Lachnospiraceae bacterium]|nr:UDP-4-amino-4,6-dideoxy-N-acetyl-beta-L-altrosamine transaminase [Lachnospiraceae bacterium]
MQNSELPAILGGTPVREKKIYYGHQCIEDDDIEAVVKVLKSDTLTCGPAIPSLERALCRLTGAEYCVAVANGTAALHIACLAAGIGPGDEVITTPMTFAASANCALYCGARPVFADINPDTYNIDPAEIERKITPRTKAVVAVDFTGQVVEIERIRAICDKHGLIFIEDAAHSIGSAYNGVPVGSLADMTTFSFHPVKTVTGGEGGAVMTSDPKLYERLSLFRTHGITREQSLMDKESEGGWYYQMVDLGYNYRITDFQAALIESQLHKIERFKQRRKEIVARYNQAFADREEIFVQKEIPQADTTRHLYIVQLKLNKLKAGRKEIFDALACENVQCNVHYIPIYTFPYYRKLGYKPGLCPKAEAAYEGFLSIPLYPAMTDEDVEDVIKAFYKVLDWYKLQ